MFQFLPNNWLSQIFKPRGGGNGDYLLDFCDGTLFKEHPLFGTDSEALQIVIYYDDVEVVNPLGSYRGIHKLGTQYLVCTYMLTKLNSFNRPFLLFLGKHQSKTKV